MPLFLFKERSFKFIVFYPVNNLRKQNLAFCFFKVLRAWESVNNTVKLYKPGEAIKSASIFGWPATNQKMCIANTLSDNSSYTLGVYTNSIGFFDEGQQKWLWQFPSKDISTRAKTSLLLVDLENADGSTNWPHLIADQATNILGCPISSGEFIGIWNFQLLTPNAWGLVTVQELAPVRGRIWQNWYNYGWDGWTYFAPTRL